MKAYTKEQVRELDRVAIEEYQIPSIVLMENAGVGATRIILKEIATQKNVAIFCGKGNNGGDGFVIARHLHNNNVQVHVFFLGKVNEIATNSDPGINLRILHNMKIPITEVSSAQDLHEHNNTLQNCDYLVDAIFGTGLCRKITGNMLEIISEIKSWRKKTIAIDTPSGLDCNSGEILGEVLPAKITITFALPKRGFFDKDGPSVTGNIEVVDISIPKELVEKL
ncbi:NAD(P)H-hydrate epimerase [Candidatus Uabimicrobium sp. HlEnr_7]|uniref:NAD(P)H-hydrate epimerase n=1 Tax=Candidatus Uabimicrobium helgolandensis TaxID=3095367 RepID=UPI0035565AC6